MFGNYSVNKHAPLTQESLMVYIGTSGWSYTHWNEVLYTERTRPNERLSHYVQRYNTVELNSSFYKWPKPITFKYWHKHLPDGFQMRVKAPRFLTFKKALWSRAMDLSY
jgi:uncharacterized protein YecE (DUF72 family)